MLADLARDGDGRAFALLASRYRAPLRRYCLRLGVPADRAEDVLQQAFLEAWAALRGGAEVISPKAWLYRIVHNLAVDDRRAAARIAILPDGVELAAERVSGAELDQALEAREALAAVAALPALQREAIVRTSIAGESYRQVGGVLGVSEDAVRGLTYRARSALRGAPAVLLPPLRRLLPGRASAAAGGIRESLARLAAGAGSAGTAAKASVVLLAAASAIATVGSSPAPDRSAPRRLPHARAASASPAGALAGGRDRAVTASAKPGTPTVGARRRHTHRGGRSRRKPGSAPASREAVGSATAPPILPAAAVPSPGSGASVSRTPASAVRGSAGIGATSGSVSPRAPQPGGTQPGGAQGPAGGGQGSTTGSGSDVGGAAGAGAAGGAGGLVGHVTGTVEHVVEAAAGGGGQTSGGSEGNGGLLTGSGEAVESVAKGAVGGGEGEGAGLLGGVTGTVEGAVKGTTGSPGGESEPKQEPEREGSGLLGGL